MTNAFTSNDDPRFDGYVMALARKQAERDFNFGLGQLVIGSVSAALFIFWTIRYFDTLGYLPSLGLCISIATLLGAHRSTRQSARNTESDLPQHLSRDEKTAIKRALPMSRFKRRQTTPGTVDYRRKVHILLLCRLLVVVALLALMVVTVSVSNANKHAAHELRSQTSLYKERTFTQHDPNLRHYTYAEYWLRHDDDEWYGIGP